MAGVPKLCLNMIVKNESHIIEERLEDLINKISFDYYVICDTGSTDNTKEIIKSLFEKKNIQGELHEHEWSDFGTNRTKALEAAYGKSEYLLIFDADEVLVLFALHFSKFLNKPISNFKNTSIFSNILPHNYQIIMSFKALT